MGTCAHRNQPRPPPDPSVRSSLKFLLSTVGLQAETFESADSFLRRKSPDIPNCLVLDVRPPGSSGLDFQRKLCGAEHFYPNSFSYRPRRHSHERSCYESRSGRISYQAISRPEPSGCVALDRDRTRRKQDKEVADLRRRFDSLTSREQEVVSIFPWSSRECSTNKLLLNSEPRKAP